MKILVVGGTGLLGQSVIEHFLKNGDEVVSLSLYDENIEVDKRVKYVYGSYLTMSDEELKECFFGCEGFVFASGIDERVSGQKPIYDMFDKYNNRPLKRLLKFAKEANVKSSVIFGSYFSYFHKMNPKWKLYDNHPYIRSRIDQEKIAESFSDDKMSVCVLELPYIFGTQKNRKPVWVFLCEMLLKMKRRIYYPKGGTTMVTVRQVGEATYGALKNNKGFNCYPIGYYNMTWVELITLFNKYMGYPNKKITTIPNFLFKLFANSNEKHIVKEGKEGGLNMAKFVVLMTNNSFIDKSLTEKLGVTDDDIKEAIKDSVELSMDVINNKKKVVEMRGE